MRPRSEFKQEDKVIDVEKSSEKENKGANPEPKPTTNQVIVFGNVFCK